MKIKLLGLTDGEYQFDGELLPANLGLPQEKFSLPIAVSVNLDKRGGNYYIKILAVATGSFSCDRCLNGFERQLSGEATIVYTENTELFADGEDEDLRFVPRSGDEIDLAGDIRDAALLMIPIKLLCSDDCKGLCPVCGANKNEAPCSCDARRIDSRWETLRKLKL